MCVYNSLIQIQTMVRDGNDGIHGFVWLSIYFHLNENGFLSDLNSVVPAVFSSRRNIGWCFCISHSYGDSECNPVGQHSLKYC
jgi:hypothetical protein